MADYAEWMDEFIVGCNGCYIAYDETQAYELGKCNTHEEAVQVLLDYVELLEANHDVCPVCSAVGCKNANCEIEMDRMFQKECYDNDFDPSYHTGSRSSW